LPKAIKKYFFLRPLATGAAFRSRKGIRWGGEGGDEPPHLGIMNRNLVTAQQTVQLLNGTPMAKYPFDCPLYPVINLSAGYLIKGQKSPRVRKMAFFREKRRFHLGIFLEKLEPPAFRQGEVQHEQEQARSRKRSEHRCRCCDQNLASKPERDVRPPFTLLDFPYWFTQATDACKNQAYGKVGGRGGDIIARLRRRGTEKFSEPPVASRNSKLPF